VQEVLQADWQEAWHSPQPPVWTVACKDALLTVTIRLAILFPSFAKSAVAIIALFPFYCK
jgi:hypothetical protein